MGSTAMQATLPGVAPAPDPASEVEGEVIGVVFEARDQAFRILRVNVKGKEQTVKGPCPKVAAGQRVLARGAWEQDARFGRQFRADFIEAVLPATEKGVAKYLEGLVSGVGPATALKIAQALGPKALEQIAADPECLRRVKGLRAERADELAQAVRDNMGTGRAFAFLHSLGLAEGLARRILTTWGARAIERVQANPYALAVEIDGIGFVLADQVAKGLGVREDAPERLRAAIRHVLGSSAGEGHVFLPFGDVIRRTSEALRSNELYTIEQELIAMAGDRQGIEIEDEDPDPLAGTEALVYLSGLLAAETASAELLARLMGTAPDVAYVSDRDIDTDIAAVQVDLGIELDELQREAVVRAVREKVVVITGGPGTGKSTLTRAIVRILKRMGRTIALASPTGKAARRLAEVTGEDATTIHRMLEYFPPENRFRRNQDRPLEVDWVILDESSMADIALFWHVLEALPPKAHLVLVGDVDQLPSVGPGTVLADLIASQAIPVVRLNRIFRQAAGSGIVVNAHRVNHGDPPWLEGETWEDFFVVERADALEARALIVEMVAERIPRKFGLDPKTQIQVIAPMHKGVLGTRELNDALRARLNPDGAPLGPHARALRVGDRVMQTSNNYDLGVMNGEIGLITSPPGEKGSVQVEFDGRTVDYPRDRFSNLELAYASSVHRQQGSEHPAVVMAMHSQHHVMLRRNLLYTGITRGKKVVVIVGRSSAVALAARTEDVSHRNTRLAQRIAQHLGT